MLFAGSAAAQDHVLNLGSTVSTIGRDHPLVGRAYDAQTRRLVPWPEFRDAIKPAAVLLVGETHDNRDHQLLQTQLLHQARAYPAAIVMEMIAVDEQPLLDQFLADHLGGSDPAAWHKRRGAFRWGSLAVYEAMFKVASAQQSIILPGDPPGERIRRVARDGISALEANNVAALGLAAPLPADQQDALLTELEGSHCGTMPKSAFLNMAVAQRYRDAHLARIAADAAPKHASVMIVAGRGHVRRDRGVPYYLSRMVPNLSVVAVAAVEVEAGKMDAETYVARGADGRAIFDYVVFTPRAERADPCEEMRRSFGKGEKK
jgi:uncharacterized iron-regulated protein